MTINEKNTELILSYLSTNKIDYALSFDIDETDETNVQAQIQINLLIEGLPCFAFFYNAKTDSVIYYSIILTINEKTLEDNVASWKEEFKPNDVFSDFIIGEDNTVHFYGEARQEGFTEELLSKIVAELQNPSSLMKHIIEASEEKLGRIKVCV